MKFFLLFIIIWNKIIFILLSLVFKTFSTKEINSVMKSLKTKNFHGYDETFTNLLKDSATYIYLPLTYICNKFILSGNFPDHLKFSFIKPIYKKGERLIFLI
jgi:hypothetical protein